MDNLLITLSESATSKIRAFQEEEDRQGMALRVAVREDGPASDIGRALRIDDDPYAMLFGGEVRIGDMGFATTSRSKTMSHTCNSKKTAINASRLTPPRRSRAAKLRA